MEFIIISDWKLESSIWRIQSKMKKTKLDREKQYWIGFIGGMRYVKQLSGEKNNDI
jgi:hypothetical protein